MKAELDGDVLEELVHCHDYHESSDAENECSPECPYVYV